MRRDGGTIGRPPLPPEKLLVEAVLSHHYQSAAPRYRSTGWREVARSSHVSSATLNRRYREWIADGTWTRFWDTLQRIRRTRTQPQRRASKFPLALTDAVLALNAVYVFFNERIFAGELPGALITIERGVGRSCPSGTFQPSGWTVGEASVDAITIGHSALAGGLEETFGTLLHEIVHQRNYSLGVTDCSARQYHNVHFRDTAALVGLQCQHERDCGYMRTSLDRRGQETIAAACRRVRRIRALRQFS